MTRPSFMNKRIPTLLGLLILIGGLVAGIVLVNRSQVLESKAGPTESPKNVKITNKGSNTFSVSWTTDTPMTGYLKYSEDPAKINLPAGDTRDQISGTSQSYTNHYVNITGLGPNKTYYFLIGSGSQTYNDSGKPFQVRTWAQASTPPEDVVSGKVLAADNAPVNGALIFLDVEGGETLSTISKNDGTWRLNIANSRDKEGKVLAYDPKKTLISIFAQAGTKGTATATTNTEKSKPVPDIVLGKNQNFLTGSETNSLIANLGDTATRSAAFDVASSSLSIIDTATSSGSIKLTYPAISGELVATSSPELRGTLAGGGDLAIKIGDIEDIITVGADGSWTWTPPSPLTPGAQEVQLLSVDENDIESSLSRNFTVLAMGDIGGLPAFVATPSATPEPTPIDEVSTMPETDDPELEQTGAIENTILLVLFALVLMVGGSKMKLYFKKYER